MKPSNEGRHVVLFDPHYGGHHGQYIAQLVDYWGRNRLPGRLDIVVPEPFPSLHGEVESLVHRHAASAIRILPTPVPERKTSGQLHELIRADLTHGRILRRALVELRPDHCLLMYLDHLLLSLALGLRFNFPVRYSGIYFRPTFHYDAFSGPRMGFRDRMAGLRKRVQLAAGTRNRHFRYLFSLDPYVIEHLGRERGRMTAVHLPDGATMAAESGEASRGQAAYPIDGERKVAVMFGSLTRRKGVIELLSATERLPADLQPSLCLLLAGRIPEDEKAELLGRVDRLRRTTRVQVVIDDRFLDDDEIPVILGGADLIVVTYQRHVGSSNVLVRAAAAGVPVLGPDYGLMGEQIRRRRLGLVVDATDPAAIARGLERYLRSSGDGPFDPEAARTFARENTVERFAATIFERILG